MQNYKKFLIPPNFLRKKIKKNAFFSIFLRFWGKTNKKNGIFMKKKEELEALYRAAIAAGLVKSKGEFAKLIGIQQSHLSHALQDDGKFNLDSLLRKARVALRDNGLDITATDSNVQIGNGNSAGIPPKKFENESEWFALVREKDKQIDRLLSIIENINR